MVGVDVHGDFVVKRLVFEPVYVPGVLFDMSTQPLSRLEVCVCVSFGG